MNNPWEKLGTVKLSPIPSTIFTDYRVVLSARVDQEIEDLEYTDTSGSFWFHRRHAPHLLSMGGSIPEAYLRSLDLPDIKYRAVSFLLISDNHEWHTDRTRSNVINISLMNGHTGRTEFGGADSFVMNDGDVYALDVTRHHRVVLTEPTKRMILSITLCDSYDTNGWQQLIQQIKEHLSATYIVP